MIADPAALVLFAGNPADPVGYAVVTLRPTVYCDGPLAVLDELYVIPDVRGGGIGTGLLARAIEDVVASGERIEPANCSAKFTIVNPAPTRESLTSIVDSC